MFVLPLMLGLLLLVVAPLLLLVLLPRLLRAHRSVEGAGGVDAAAECRVVVVGGGFGGLTLCQALLSSRRRPQGLSVVLVEARDYFEYTPGILRALVRPSHHPQLLTPIASLPLTRDPAFRHLRAVASTICPSSHTLRAGAEQLPFDFLVLAAGSAYDANIKPIDLDSRETQGGGATPVSLVERRQSAAATTSAAAVDPPNLSVHSMSHRIGLIQQLHARIVAAHSITIVGAGLELAAELVIVGLSKRVELLCKSAEHAHPCEAALGSTLLPNLPPRAGRYAARWLQRRGVTICFHNIRTPAQTRLQHTTHSQHTHAAPALSMSAAPDVGSASALSPAVPLLFVVCALPLVTAMATAGAERSGDEDGRGDGLVFDCTGLLAVPLPAVIAGEGGGQKSDGSAAAVPPSLVARKGVVSVNAQLQVEEDGCVHQRLFCIGDCCQPPQPCGKLAYTAELQATVAAHNILALHHGDRQLSCFPKSLSSVLPAPVIICCSLGAWDGVLVFNDLAVMGWPAALMKWLIEVSKVRQYRGSRAAELLWTIAEPSVFAVNRLYQLVKSSLSWAVTAPMHTRHTQ